jgi:hypothetical protein
MNYASLITAISDAHRQAQAGADGAVNRGLVLRNWVIGAYLDSLMSNLLAIMYVKYGCVLP